MKKGKDGRPGMETTGPAGGDRAIAGGTAGVRISGPAGRKQTGGRPSGPSAARMPMQLAAGDRLKLKKKHPCGGSEFEVVRTGMDIRLQCLTCGSQILLPRRKLDKMTAGRITREPGSRGSKDTI